MARSLPTNYRELKENLSAPARRVVEELVEGECAPEDVLQRLVHEERCDIYQAYGYVREVLWRSLMEMTGAEAHVPLSHAGASPGGPGNPVAAG